MYLRISSLAAALAVLTACEMQTAPEPEGDPVECAIGPGTELSAVCTLERPGDLTDGDAGDLYLIHHPDGGFRRIAIDPYTGNASNVDGSVALVIAPAAPADRLDFTVGEDRYSIRRSLLDKAPE